jgi:hypothetical protein
MNALCKGIEKISCDRTPASLVFSEGMVYSCSSSSSSDEQPAYVSLRTLLSASET